IVKIEEKMKTEFLRRLSQGDCVLQIIGEFFRRVKNAQPHPVVSMILEDHEAGLCLAIVVKNFPAIFHRLQERDIGSDGVFVFGRACAGSGAKEQEKQNAGRASQRKIAIDHLLRSLTTSYSGINRTSSSFTASPLAANAGDAPGGK